MNKNSDLMSDWDGKLAPAAAAPARCEPPVVDPHAALRDAVVDAATTAHSHWVKAENSVGTAEALHRGQYWRARDGIWAACDRLRAALMAAAKEALGGMTELLPCPCCRGKAITVSDFNEEISFHEIWVECTGCGLQTAVQVVDPNQHAIEKQIAECLAECVAVWNRRAPQPNGGTDDR